MEDLLKGQQRNDQERLIKNTREWGSVYSVLALLYAIYNRWSKCPHVNIQLKFICIVSVLFPTEAAFLCFTIWNNHRTVTNTWNYS